MHVSSGWYLTKYNTCRRGGENEHNNDLWHDEKKKQPKNGNRVGSLAIASLLRFIETSLFRLFGKPLIIMRRDNVYERHNRRCDVPATENIYAYVLIYGVTDKQYATWYSMIWLRM